jgi:hypothetical protein
MIEIKKIGNCLWPRYPQQRDKFFRITKNSFSFVRPPYPDHLGISAGQIIESLLEFIAAGTEAELDI